MQEICLRAIEVVLQQPLTCFTPEALLSWLITLLMDPRTSFTSPKGSQQHTCGAARHYAVVATVCRLLHRSGGLPQLLGVMAPTLVQTLGNPSCGGESSMGVAKYSKKECHGVLQLVITVLDSCVGVEQATLVPQALGDLIPRLAAAMLLQDSLAPAAAASGTVAGNRDPSDSAHSTEDADKASVAATGNAAAGGAIVFSGAAVRAPLSTAAADRPLQLSATSSADVETSLMLLTARPGDFLVPVLQALEQAADSMIKDATAASITPAAGKDGSSSSLGAAAAAAANQVESALQAMASIVAHQPLQLAILEQQVPVSVVAARMQQHSDAVRKVTGQGAAVHYSKQLHSTLQHIYGRSDP